MKYQNEGKWELPQSMLLFWSHPLVPRDPIMSGSHYPPSRPGEALLLLGWVFPCLRIQHVTAQMALKTGADGTCAAPPYTHPNTLRALPCAGCCAKCGMCRAGLGWCGAEHSLQQLGSPGFLGRGYRCLEDYRHPFPCFSPC